MGLKEWAEKKNREVNRKTREDLAAHRWHSQSYHRYFEGYTEYQETDEKGRNHLKRVYTGTWYRQDLSQRGYWLVRCLYVLLFLLMAGVLWLAAYGHGSGGRAFYVALPETATLCMLAWLFYVLFVNYLFAPRKMTIHDYRVGSKSLQRSAMWIAGCFGVALLGTVVDYWIVPGNAAEYRSFWLTLGAFTLGAAAALLMARIEKNLPYLQEQSEDKPEVEGIPIENERLQGLFRREE